MVSCLLKIRAQAGAAPSEGSEITCVFKRLISSAISYPTAPSKNIVFYDGYREAGKRRENRMFSLTFTVVWSSRQIDTKTLFFTIVLDRWKFRLVKKHGIL